MKRQGDLPIIMKTPTRPPNANFDGVVLDGRFVATIAATTTTSPVFSNAPIRSTGSGSTTPTPKVTTTLRTTTLPSSTSPTTTGRSLVGASAAAMASSTTQPETQSSQLQLTLPAVDSNPSTVVPGSQSQSGLPVQSESNRAKSDVADAEGGGGAGFPTYAIGVIVGGGVLAIAAVIAVILLKKKSAASKSAPIDGSAPIDESNVDSASAAGTGTITIDMYSPPPRSLAGSD